MQQPPWRSRLNQRAGVALVFICGIGLYIFGLTVAAGHEADISVLAVLLVGLLVGLGLFSRYRGTPQRRDSGRIMQALSRRPPEAHPAELPAPEPAPAKPARISRTRRTRREEKEVEIKAPEPKKRRGLFG